MSVKEQINNRYEEIEKKDMIKHIEMYSNIDSESIKEVLERAEDFLYLTGILE